MPRKPRNASWYVKMDTRLTLLLSEFDPHMSNFEKGNILSFINAGEPGLALEGICDFIVEFGYEISRKTFEEIKCLANEMSMDDSFWRSLEKQVHFGDGEV